MSEKQQKNPKYSWFDETKGLWVIRRTMKGKRIYFGTYKTRQEVEKAVEIFNRVGWNPIKTWAVKAKVKEELYGE